MRPDQPDATAARPKSSRDRSLAGWLSSRAAWVSGLLLLEGISGVWLWLGPFGVTGQLLVLLHVVWGLLLLPLVPGYLWRHLRAWWRQRPTAEMILGYALLAALAVSAVSGLVNAWDAAVGPRLAGLWDLTHLVSGLAVVGLLAAHVVTAALRRLVAARRDAELGRAMAGFPRRLAVGVGAGVALVAVVAVPWPRPELRRAVPEDYALPAYVQAFDEYRGNPFAPTYARTDDLRLVEPRLLAGSASCGSAGCHAEILDEWEPSAHRFAAMNPPFQAVQRQFAEEREAAETRYCAGCHDPISLFAGAKDPSAMDLSAPGVEEGISCIACHAVSQVDERGNADYVLTPPRPYLGEHGDGWSKRVADFLIRAWPRQHLADYDRNLLRSAEFCGACHKQFIPEALNRFGLVEGQNQYDEWKASHWHTDDPATDLSCRDCHMRLVPDSSDPGRGEDGDRRRTDADGAHRHHGFIATNNFMPAVLELPHWEEQVRLTEEWIRGETVIPEIAHRWPAGPVAAMRLAAPDEVAAGSELEVRVTVSNRKAGHNFITGPLDFVRAWVHLQATDATGRLLGEWGAIDPATRRIQDEAGREHEIGNPRDRGTMVLEALPVDGEGRELRRHELWRKAGGKGRRVVFPAYADSQRFRLRVPADAVGPVTLTARLEYRRYRQEFLDLVVPELEAESGVLQPSVTQATAESRVAVVDPVVDPERTDVRVGHAGG